MAKIPIEIGAAKLGVPVETVDSWVQNGLVEIEVRVPQVPPGKIGFLTVERFVDEDQLQDVAESLGWLQLSGDSWDGPEVE